MNNKKTIPLILVTLSLFACAGFWGCSRQSSRSATEKRYDLKGKVIAVEKDKHLITVAHEDIKDFMPGMTMPFTVGEQAAWVFEAPHEVVPGDQITAALVVDGPRARLEDIVITKEGTETAAPVPGQVAEAKAGDEVPNYRLMNQDGKAIHIHDYKGKILLLTFIFTRCQDPDQCSLMSSNFATIDHELEKQLAWYERTHLLSISFDPEYDTPKVLRSYGAAYTGRYTDETFAHWEFASGSTDEVKGIAQFFGLRYYKDTQSGKEQVIHSLRTVVIGPDSKIIKVYRGNDWKPDEVVKDLQTPLAKKQ
ncbi:MAG: SCO family protein [bacterium]